MKYDCEQIGKNIREERKKLGLTQDELGKLLFVTGKQISNYEKGKPLPSLETLLKMAELFHCEFGYLLGEESYKERSQLNTAICKSFGITSNAVESLRKAIQRGLNRELGERQRIISRFFASPFLSEFFDRLVDAASLSNRLFLSGNTAYDDLVKKYGEDIAVSAVKVLLRSPDEEDDSLEGQSEGIEAAVKELDSSIDRGRNEEYALKVAKYELREAFETLVRDIL